MKKPRFKFGVPQRIAAGMLLVFLAQCLYVIGRAPLSETDYRYALCGREMWERPAPMAGYFTSCGNLQGDGTLAYRVAGAPLSLTLAALRVSDWAHAKLDKNYEREPIGGATHDLRHQIKGIPYLLRVPFALFAVWIGGGVWWVSRRLFGNPGGVIALGLFCFSPWTVSYATRPNNEILALWGLYGLIYTAVGIAHAMYGPRRKWRPRMVLFAVALGLTASAHLLAAGFGLVAATVLMFYLADRRRPEVPSILIFTTIGAFLVLFACFALRVHAMLYAFTGGAARFVLSTEPARHLMHDTGMLPTTVAVAVCLVLYVFVRRSRYFGNTVPLVIAAMLFPLVTTEVATAPWMWALPFVFTFVAGVLSDALETKQRKLYVAMSGCLLLAQAVLCWSALPLMGM